MAGAGTREEKLMPKVTNPSMSYGGSGSTNEMRASRPMPRFPRRVLGILVVGLATLAGGCGGKGGQAPNSSGGPVVARPPERPGATQTPISNTDPCAIRLHDLCAPLLLYYSANASLPPRLEDLREVAGFQDQVVLTCPVSNRPYVYNPVGVVNPNQAERVIVYDAEPHQGIRWAISIIEPQGNGPLITKVIGLQESQFHFSLPR
jgi:hypothetical protein